MVRQLYPGTFVQLSSGLPGPGLPVQIWTDLLTGTNVTSQLLGSDNASAFVATTDGNGNLQPFRGPDGYSGMLFVDSNVGIRYELVSPTAWDTLQSTVAGLVATPPGSGAVTSVAGRTGDVTVTKADVGLSNVANLAAADLPVSTATQAALDAKPADALLLHKAGAENVTGVKTFTVSPVVPTPINPTDAANRAYVLANAGTGGSGISTTTLESYLATTNTPYELYAASGGAGAYPPRPATLRPVHFFGAVPPTSDGSTAGGGGMVANKDQWFNWTAQ